MRKLGLIWILFLVPIVSSCLAVAALSVGAGVVGYVYYDKNEAWRDFGAPFDQTWKATKAALKDLKYELPKDAKPTDEPGYLMIDDVRIHVEERAEGRTRVSIRVGTFHTEDHRRRAGEILDRIGARL